MPRRKLVNPLPSSHVDEGEEESSSAKKSKKEKIVVKGKKNGTPQTPDAPEDTVTQQSVDTSLPKKGRPPKGTKQIKPKPSEVSKEVPPLGKRNLSLEALVEVVDSELQSMQAPTTSTVHSAKVEEPNPLLSQRQVANAIQAKLVIDAVTTNSAFPATTPPPVSTCIQQVVRIPSAEKGIEKYELKSDSLQEQGLKLIYTKQTVEGSTVSGFPPHPRVEVQGEPKTQIVQIPEFQKQVGPGRKRKHPPKPGKHVCPYCGRGCAKPSVLQKHVRAHTGERPYPCIPCGFSFKTKSNLYKHRKSRTHALKAGQNPDSSDGNKVDCDPFESEGECLSDSDVDSQEDDSVDTSTDMSYGSETVQKTSNLQESLKSEITVDNDSSKPLTQKIVQTNSKPDAVDESQLVKNQITASRVVMTDRKYYDIVDSSQVQSVNSAMISRQDSVRSSVDSLPDKSLKLTIQVQKAGEGGAVSNDVAADPNRLGRQSIRPEIIRERITQLISENQAIVDTPMAEPPRAKRLSRQNSEATKSESSTPHGSNSPRIIPIQSHPLSGLVASVEKSHGVTATTTNAQQSFLGLMEASGRPPDMLDPQQIQQSLIQATQMIGSLSDPFVTTSTTTTTTTPQEIKIHIKFPKMSPSVSPLTTTGGQQMIGQPGVQFPKPFTGPQFPGIQALQALNIPHGQSSGAHPSTALHTGITLPQGFQLQQVITVTSNNATATTLSTATEPVQVASTQDSSEGSVIKDLLLKGRSKSVPQLKVAIPKPLAVGQGDGQPVDDYGPYLCKECKTSFRRPESLEIHRQFYCPVKRGETSQSAPATQEVLKETDRAEREQQIIQKFFPNVSPQSQTSGHLSADGTKIIEWQMKDDHHATSAGVTIEHTDANLPKKKGRPKGSKNKPKETRELHSAPVVTGSSMPTFQKQLVSGSQFPTHLLGLAGTTPPVVVNHKGPISSAGEVAQAVVSIQPQTSKPGLTLKMPKISELSSQVQSPTLSVGAGGGTPGTPQPETPTALWKLRLKGKILMKRSMSVERMLSQEADKSGTPTPTKVMSNPNLTCQIPPEAPRRAPSVLKIESEHQKSDKSNEQKVFSTEGLKAIDYTAQQIKIVNVEENELAAKRRKTDMPLLCGQTIPIAQPGIMPIPLGTPIQGGVLSSVANRGLIELSPVQLMNHGHAFVLPGIPITMPMLPVQLPGVSRNRTLSWNLGPQTPHSPMTPKTPLTPSTPLTPTPGGSLLQKSPVKSPNLDLTGRQQPAVRHLLTVKQTIEKNIVPLMLYGHTYPTLRSQTHTSFCCVQRPQPMYAVQGNNRKISMYSNWKVADFNPNPEGLSSRLLLDLYNSSQRSSDPRDTIANISPKTGVLTHSSYWNYYNKQRVVQSISTQQQKQNTAKSPDIVKEEETGVQTPVTEVKQKEDWTQVIVLPSSEKVEVEVMNLDEKRNKSFTGGYVSKDEYVYVRGRGRGKYVCEECGIRCKKPSMLKKHIRTHTDVRPYHCKHCKFSFKTKGNLTKHMKSKAHHKKCMELGIFPIPVCVEDSQIDPDALARQIEISKESKIKQGDLEDDDDDDEDDSEDEDLQIDVEDEEDEDEDSEMEDQKSDGMVDEVFQTPSKSPSSSKTILDKDKGTSTSKGNAKPPTVRQILNQRRQPSTADENTQAIPTKVGNQQRLGTIYGFKRQSSVIDPKGLQVSPDTKSDKRSSKKAQDSSKSPDKRPSIDDEIARSLLDLSNHTATSAAGQPQITLSKPLAKEEDRAVVSMETSEDTGEQATRLTSLIGALKQRTHSTSESSDKSSKEYRIRAYHQFDGEKSYTETSEGMVEKKKRSRKRKMSSCDESIEQGEMPSPEKESLHVRPGKTGGLHLSLPQPLMVVTGGGFVPPVFSPIIERRLLPGQGISQSQLPPSPVKLSVPAQSIISPQSMKPSSSSSQMASVLSSEKVESHNAHGTTPITAHLEVRDPSLGQPMVFQSSNTEEQPMNLSLHSEHQESEVIHESNDNTVVRSPTTPSSKSQQVMYVTGDNRAPFEIMPIPGFVIDSSDSLVDGKYQCNVCQKTFPKQHQLTLHKNIHYIERPFKCDDCSISFRTAGHLQKHQRSDSHLKIHSMNMYFGVPSTDNPRPYKCDDCKIAFRIHGHLAKHLRSKAHIATLERVGKLPPGSLVQLEKTDLSEIDATDGDTSLLSLQQLLASLAPEMFSEASSSVAPVAQTVTANQTWVVPHDASMDVVQQEVSTESSMPTLPDDTGSCEIRSKSPCEQIETEVVDEHIDNQKQSPLFHFMEGYQAIPSASNANVTVEIKNEPIEMYDVKTQQLRSMDHEGGRFSEEDLRSRTCTVCNKVFKSASYAQNHKKSQHSQGKPFRCPYPNCDKEYISKDPFTHHLATHSGEKSANEEVGGLKCGICAETCSSMAMLKQHLVSHAELRPYVCEYCDAGFTNGQSLKIHIRTHTQERPYICGHCGDTFTSSNDLKIHVKTHRGHKVMMTEEMDNRGCTTMTRQSLAEEEEGTFQHDNTTTRDTMEEATPMEEKDPVATLGVESNNNDASTEMPNKETPQILAIKEHVN